MIVIPFFRGKVSWNSFLSYTDPETESEPQSADQTTSGSQEVDGESPEDSSLNSHSESSSPATTDNAAASASPSQEKIGLAGFETECTYFDEDEEQSETEEDSNPNVSWDQEDQPLHPIVADWNEDMRAIKMLKKALMKKKIVIKKGEL